MEQFQNHPKQKRNCVEVVLAELKAKAKVGKQETVMIKKEVKVGNLVEEDLLDGGSLRKRKYNKVTVCFSALHFSWHNLPGNNLWNFQLVTQKIT